MKTNIINTEVLYIEDPIVRVDRQDIKRLKAKSDANERKRIRLCGHRDLEDPIHEMLIIHKKNTYIKPHRHLNKIESFHIIEGTAEIVIYSDDGSVTDVIPMGEYASERKFFYRLSDPLFHTLLISSDYLIFHETTNGPFRRSDTIWAAWAPDEDDLSAVKEFMAHLTHTVDHFITSDDNQ